MSKYRLIRARDYHCLIADGSYKAVIHSVGIIKDQVIKGYKRDIAEITFRTKDNIDVSERYVLHLTENSKIAMVLYSVFGEIPDEIDLAELEGKKCIIDVKNKETADGRKFSNVKAVYSYDGDGDEYEEDEYEEIDYDEMNRKELKSLCKKRGITVKRKDTKENLIEILEEWDEENEEEYEEEDEFLDDDEYE